MVKRFMSNLIALLRGGGWQDVLAWLLFLVIIATTYAMLAAYVK